ncbi:MAG: hypothetical protein F8N39_08550 [Clostridiaceae bacterium]|nr:hypothetical protein [Clostridiaceae bacterium]
MINDNLYLIQEQFDKKFLNLNIQNFDKHKYNLLISDIIYVISSIMPKSNLTEDNLTTEFTKKYLLIRSIGFLNALNDSFCVYLEIENNTFSNIEVSILC